MSKRLFALNTFLVVTALLLAMYIARELVRSHPMPAQRAPGGSAVPAVATATPAVPPGSYAVITSRNLFSPTRSEAPAAAASAGPVVQFNKPNLYGVVLRDGAPIAYIEDPVTKRVAGYRLGDQIAGGKLTKIAVDHVILARPDGTFDIRLHDPSRPRPAVAAPPGQFQPMPGASQLPSPVPGFVPPAQPQDQPGQVVQPTPPVPFRRPLPPVLRRQPEGTPGVPTQ